MKDGVMPLTITARIVRPSDRQRALVDDLQRIMEKHGQLTPGEVLALASQMVGVIIARQPPNLAPSIVTAIVRDNIEIGNAVAVASLRDAEPVGSA